MLCFQVSGKYVQQIATSTEKGTVERLEAPHDKMAILKVELSYSLLCQYISISKHLNKHHTNLDIVLLCFMKMLQSRAPCRIFDAMESNYMIPTLAKD